MNKTVSINLAGTFFHIDENAFEVLSRYLDSIRKSLQNDAGTDEIMKDIEARIAELFTEKIHNTKQVVTLKEVEEVIEVMGQPEDYSVDEEIFEDQPKQEKSKKSRKQLFRDPDDKYIGGVASGLGHYIGIDPVWLRLLWVILAIFSSGTFILIYIIFWIVVPDAVTAADKLKMKGEAITISNIEKKVKESFDNVAQHVKKTDFSSLKTGSENFFSAIGKVITGVFEVFGKLIGAFALFIGATTLISLFIGLFFGSFSQPLGFLRSEFFVLENDFALPFWAILLMVFFAIGIPFFYLFLLGLKTLFKNLKPLGKVVNIPLVSLWVLSLIGLIWFGVYQATEHSYDGQVIETQVLPITAQDTLFLAMESNIHYEKEMSRKSGFSLRYDTDNNQVIYSKNVRLVVKSTKDSLGKVVVEKQSQGRDFLKAKNRSEQIQYHYSIKNNQLLLDGYFVSDYKSGYRNQKVEVTVYLPIGATLFADKNTSSYHLNTSRYGDLLKTGMEEHYLTVVSDDLLCVDCPQVKTEVHDTEPEKNVQIRIEVDTQKTDHIEIDWDSENWKEQIKN